MITCYLQGGLGNQMFQIAAVTALAIENNDIAVFDKRNHNLPLQGRKADCYIDNVFRNINFSDSIKTMNFYKEEEFFYKKIPYRESLTVSGYFQSEKYFYSHEKQIRELFSPSEKTINYLLDKYPQIAKQGVTSIHVRRGDYLKFKDIHPPCSLKYYVEATKKFKNSDFFVFSDDPDWCQKVFKSEKFTIISEEQDYNELYLMSMCKNNIIANSSFSWWAAWLNKNQNKTIIAPKQWFGPSAQMTCRDVIPEKWSRI